MAFTLSLQPRAVLSSGDSGRQRGCDRFREEPEHDVRPIVLELEGHEDGDDGDQGDGKGVLGSVGCERKASAFAPHVTDRAHAYLPLLALLRSNTKPPDSTTH